MSDDFKDLKTKAMHLVQADPDLTKNYRMKELVDSPINQMQITEASIVGTIAALKAVGIVK